MSNVRQVSINQLKLPAVLTAFFSNKLKGGTSFFLFFFVFFGFHALVRAFFPIYIKNLGFSPFEIAVITSVEDLANLFASLAVIGILSRLFSSRQIVIGGLSLKVLFFIPFFWISSFWKVTLAWFLLLFVSRSPLVCAESAAVQASFNQRISYGRCRIGGSLGFVVFTVLIGLLFDIYGVSSILCLGLLILLGLLITAIKVRDVFSAEVSQMPGSRLKIFQNITAGITPTARLFLLVQFLVWSGNAVFYTYFSIYLQELGWSGAGLSGAWAVAVFSEVVVYFFFEALERQFSLSGLFRISIVATALRWFVVGTISATPIILLSQLLHAFTIAGFITSSNRLMHLLLGEGYRGNGQALLIAVGPGLGVFIGRIVAGSSANWLPASVGYGPIFFGAALVVLIAYLIAHRIEYPDS